MPRTASTPFDRLVGWRESSTSGAAIADGLEAARSSPAAASARSMLAAAERVVVTGAGSSYFLAQSASAAAREATRRPFVAAPLSELILRPGGVLLDGRAAAQPVIVISRSGSTSEAVTVIERMRALGHPTIAVTCRAASPITSIADATLVSVSGDEQAIVMTRSFASMLALLIRLIADVAADEGLAADLDLLPERWTDSVVAARIGRRLGGTNWSRIVILGGGVATGIAAEWGLKLTETSQVPTLVCEPLEFRHGPISVCEPGMLVVGLLGGPGASDELRVVAESADLGASTWVLTQEPPEPAVPDGLVSLVGGGLRAAARLPLLLHPAHALAFSLAATRGENPDVPRHLGQVVIIDPP